MAKRRKRRRKHRPVIRQGRTISPGLTLDKLAESLGGNKELALKSINRLNELGFTDITIIPNGGIRGQIFDTRKD